MLREIKLEQDNAEVDERDHLHLVIIRSLQTSVLCRAERDLVTF